jgi:hypothetical protein
MHKPHRVLIVLATLATPVAVHAENSPPPGHWEWSVTPSVGPRAPLVTPTRRWVPNDSNVTRSGCTCRTDLMKGVDRLSTNDSSTSKR